MTNSRNQLSGIIGERFSEPRRLPIAALRAADSPRSGGEDAEHVRLLADQDAPLPPIVVHRPTMRVIDGMHRLRAAALRGEREIEAVFFDGPQEDVFVLSVGLNSAHGLPLGQADRNAAAARIITTHWHWSDRAIASVAGISAKTVAALRRRSTGEVPHSNGRVGRDGRVRAVDPGAGRRRAGAVLAERPGASLREIAARAGISLSTAKDVRERVRNGQDPLPPRQRGAPRAAPTRAHAPREPVRDEIDAELRPIVQTLKRDPALRQSEMGRRVLTLLDVHALESAEWDKLAANVPTHCATTVADAARKCAASLQNFASELERRDAPR
ncbi:ParB/RepB/Spo0J family partition protein [Spongiactinospora sp. 9N601]|uniref:ParB/RepB/Spo0J family partition protein n=1 Tax=Spongiactinospora sp. 9N601 TaxID=3375149 RepID=UPI0037B722E7